MSRIQSQEELIDFFRDYIFGFIFNDISNCIQAKANYVVAMALCAYTEYIGSLITGKLGVDKQSEKNFNAALEYFNFNGDDNYYKKFKIEYIDENGKSSNIGIYKIFRCGLIHEYFIKGDSLVVNDPFGLADLSKIPGIGWSNGRLTFATNAYFRDFQKAVMKWYKLLIIDRNNGLIKNFSESLDRIASRDVKEIK